MARKNRCHVHVRSTRNIVTAQSAHEDFKSRQQGSVEMLQGGVYEYCTTNNVHDSREDLFSAECEKNRERNVYMETDL